MLVQEPDPVPPTRRGLTKYQGGRDAFKVFLKAPALRLGFTHFF